MDKKTLLISTLTFLHKERNRLVFQANSIKLKRQEVSQALRAEEDRLMKDARKIDARIKKEVDENIDLLQE